MSDDLRFPVLDNREGHDGHLSVGSGDQCVFLGEHDVPKWRNAVLLSPDEARRLAHGLIRMAYNAEHLADDDSDSLTRVARPEDVLPPASDDDPTAGPLYVRRSRRRREGW